MYFLIQSLSIMFPSTAGSIQALKSKPKNKKLYSIVLCSCCQKIKHWAEWLKRGLCVLSAPPPNPLWGSLSSLLVIGWRTCQSQQTRSQKINPANTRTRGPPDRFDRWSVWTIRTHLPSADVQTSGRQQLRNVKNNRYDLIQITHISLKLCICTI